MKTTRNVQAPDHTYCVHCGHLALPMVALKGDGPTEIGYQCETCFDWTYILVP
jgi:hypothetical protein